MVPELHTYRLILRGLMPQDYPAFHDIWTEPAVVRFIGGAPRPGDESWAALLKLAGNWPLFGFGTWAIVARDSGRLIGQTGFQMARRGFTDLDTLPECGWVLASAAQGRGLGAEAVDAVHGWFDAQRLGASYAMVALENAASLRLAARVGYRPLRRDSFADAPVDLLLRQP